MSADKKLSKTQIAYIIHRRRSFGSWLANIGTKKQWKMLYFFS